MFDQGEEVALGRIFEVDGVVGITAFEEEFSGREVEAGADFFITVALEAVVDEGVANRLLEEGGAGLHPFGVTRWKLVRAKGEDQEEKSETEKWPTHSKAECLNLVATLHA